MGVTAGVVSAITTVASTAYGINRSEEARSEQKQAERDAKREQAEAAAKARKERNNALMQEAMRRRRLAEQSLGAGTSGGTILTSPLGAGVGAPRLGG